MPAAGSRQILAPPHRVAVALRDPAFLQSIGAHAEPIPAEPGEDPGIDLSVGSERVHFALQGDHLGTQLAYESQAADELGLRAEIERMLDRLQSEIAGPREVAADSPLVNTAKAVSEGSPFRGIPTVIFGMPLIFWAGTAVFLFIFAMMFSAYL